MMIPNPPRSQAKTDEKSTEVVIGDCHSVIVRVPQLVPGPCGDAGIPWLLTTLKERKVWNAKLMGTTISALRSRSARNSERRPQVSLKLLTWTTERHVDYPASSPHLLWALFASPPHLNSRRIFAKVPPPHAVVCRSLFLVLQTYLERSPLFAPPPTI